MIVPEHVAELVRDDQRHLVTVVAGLDPNLSANDRPVEAVNERIAGLFVPANPDENLRGRARGLDELDPNTARVPRIRGRVDGPRVRRGLDVVRDRSHAPLGALVPVRVRRRDTEHSRQHRSHHKRTPHR